MKPFNLEQALAGAPVVTRDGRKVLSIAHLPTLDASGGDSIFAHVEGHGIQTTYRLNGRYLPYEENARDLFMAPTKRTVWVNIYRGSRGRLWAGDPRDTKEEATSIIGTGLSALLGTFPIEIEE